MTRKNRNVKPLDLHVLIEKEAGFIPPCVWSLTWLRKAALWRKPKNIAEAIQLRLQEMVYAH